MLRRRAQPREESDVNLSDDAATRRANFGSWSASTLALNRRPPSRGAGSPADWFRRGTNSARTPLPILTNLSGSDSILSWQRRVA